MVRHIVLIKSDKITEVESVLQRLKILAERVPELESVEVGKDFTGRHKGYAHLFILNFTSRNGLKTWANHPEHEPIRTALMRIAEMIVFDYEL